MCALEKLPSDKNMYKHVPNTNAASNLLNSKRCRVTEETGDPRASQQYKTSKNVEFMSWRLNVTYANPVRHPSSISNANSVTRRVGHELASLVFAHNKGNAENAGAITTPALWCRDFHSRDFHPCILVPRFPLPRFPPLQFGAAISTPAISTPAFLLLPHFPLPRFQSPHNKS